MAKTTEKKLTFEVLKPGRKFSIGERIITLDTKTSIEDAKAIAEQYPNENFLKFKNEPVTPTPEDDTQGNQA